MEEDLKFCKLSEAEYLSFFQESSLKNFMNSIEAYNAKKLNNWQAELLGVKDESGKVIAATILASIPVMKFFRYYYAQRGFLLDYNNQELLNFFTKNIKQYAKQNKGLYLVADPNILVFERDIDGNKVIDGYDNSFVLEKMQKAGFKHKEFKTGYDNAGYVRYMFTILINGRDEKELLKGMNSQAKRSIQKMAKQGIKIEELALDKIDVFLQMMDQTAERRNFHAREHSFFKNIVSSYGEHGKVILAYLDVEERLTNLQNEKAEFEKELAKLNSAEELNKKKQNKLVQLKEALATNAKRLVETEELKAEYGTKINLSTAFFTIYDDEIVYVYGGSDNKLRKFNAAYAPQWYMIKEAIKNNINRYNFYGISGDFSEDADDYGVYAFKRGFGGVVEELIGDFILPLRPMTYKLYNLLKKI